MGFLRAWFRPDSAQRVMDPAERYIDFGSATDVGSRKENQDRMAVTSSWAIVSDGVGGQAGGSLAAALTVAHVVERFGEIRDGFDAECVETAVAEANEAVRSARNENREVSNMGATLTLAAAKSVTKEQSEWLVANVGDSPAWLVTAEGCTQVTEDHTLTGAMVRSGALTPEEAASHPQRHVIVRAIGVEEHVEADVQIFVLKPGYSLVLASDGLSDVLDPASICQVVGSAPTAKDAAERLVSAALDRQTADNVTVAVLRHLPSLTDGPAAS